MHKFLFEKQHPTKAGRKKNQSGAGQKNKCSVATVSLMGQGVGDSHQFQRVAQTEKVKRGGRVVANIYIYFTVKE